MRLRTLSSLALFGALNAGAAVLGARATRRGKGLWYRRLEKPPFNPPDWVFGPVWTTIYSLSSVSAWRISRAPRGPARTKALAWWGAQLALNAAWSPLFFGRHRKRAALVDIGLLLGALSGYTAQARKLDRPAAWMMAPYLAWGSFATLLNAEIVRRNR